MGIKRLFNALKERFVDKNLNEFEGKRVGIDGMSWLYQVFYSISEMPDRLHLPIVRKMEAKFKLLQKHNISFIVVMDGKRLEGKRVAQEKRLQKRQYYLEQAESTDPYMDIDTQTAYERYSQVIGPDIVYFFLDYLKFREIEFLVAPYEADTQLVHMCNTGEIDYIAGEDSDFFAMSCFNLLRNLRFEKDGGACSLFDDKSATGAEQSPRWEQFCALEPRRRALLCVMNGCDYIDNLSRVGFNTLLNFFYKHKDAKEDDFAARAKERLQESHGKAGAQFVDECLNILNAFTAQIVYDSASRQLVHMAAPRGSARDIAIYTGTKFGDFERFVAGELDIETMKPRPATDYDFERVLQFINQTTREHVGGIANLSAGPATFDTFMNGKSAPQSCRDAGSRAPSRGRSVDRRSAGPRSRSQSTAARERARGSERALSSKLADQATRASFRSGCSLQRVRAKRCKNN